MQFEIARCVAEDAESLVELGRSTYREYFGHVWSKNGLAHYLDQQWRLDRLMSDLSADRVRYYRVAVNGRIIGYAKLVCDRRAPVQGIAGVELEKLYFEPNSLGAGYGSMTIRRLLSEANAAGFASLWLEVLRTNLRGKQFYERESFALLGTRPFATDLAEIGIWVMARTTLASASV